MRPLISEFSFGYALTEELVRGRHGLLVGAPIFPTQNQEGREGGYDIHLPFIGMPIFLQFKLSEYLQRRYAKEWHLFRGPYYRMHLRPLRLSSQHNLLLELESHRNKVFYVAPEFHTQEELNNFYLSSSIINNVAFFRPSDIGRLPDIYDHYIVYQCGNIEGWLCSDEPNKIYKSFAANEFVPFFLELIRQQQSRLDIQFFSTLNSNLILFLEEKNFDVKFLQVIRERSESLEENIRLSAYIARTYFDAQLILLGVNEDYAQQ